MRIPALVRFTRTMAFQKPLPVVICGRTTKVSTAVTAGLRPDYDVIHSVMSLEAGKLELPNLLRTGSATAAEAPSDTLPTPIAIIVGGGYSQDDFESMRAACQGLKPIPWLKVAPKDMSTFTPGLSDYGGDVAERIKACLDQIAEKRELDIDHVHIV